ncbi:MAG: polymer-forming cytoskeletal protein [Gammaproteobacteria bacterium]|nr:polymer-forming cytoskeletal protein [Gammaproteobacteria bacterium]MCP5442194.1 polymer-forming cytoskeletal protein [Chromatiaceae bacterium]
MIGRKNRFRVPRITTVIGVGTVIQGSIQFAGGIHVDGTIHGDVLAEQDEKSTFILSDTGVVEGDVRVPNVILNGSVVGDVLASGRVELAANARVSGTLYYKLLEMEMGAEVNGQLVYVEDGEVLPPRLEHDGGPGNGKDLEDGNSQSVGREPQTERAQ